MSQNINLSEVLAQFVDATVMEAYGNGHINDTYSVGKAGGILQRINTSVFPNPDDLMENIENVTAFLRKKIAAEGGNPERETLCIMKTIDGKSYYRLDDEHVYRMYRFVEDTKTIEEGKCPEELFEAGAGFGRFQRMLEDYPAESLHEIIPNFHDTPKRVEALKQAIAEDKVGRVSSAKKEIDFALKQAEWADVVVKALEDGSVPLRVTHNDTKINNILFDKDTGKATCVIDLDTVMPGSALYDFGDALRVVGSTAAEDETDLNMVWFNESSFVAFARGYLSEMKDSLTKRELELLPLSVKLITFECGTRFLTDYLNGDTYFKIHREKHNLERARNQYKLVEDIARKETVLQEIIQTISDEK